jgi:hypothetical protein
MEADPDAQITGTSVLVHEYPAGQVVQVDSPSREYSEAAQSSPSALVEHSLPAGHTVHSPA